MSACQGLSGLPFYLVWLSPLYTALSLYFWTGIPYLERYAEEKWGLEHSYQSYKERTNLLILWPPKREAQATRMLKRGYVEGARGSAKHHHVKDVEPKRQSLSPKHRQILERLKGKASATKTDLAIQDLFQSRAPGPASPR